MGGSLRNDLIDGAALVALFVIVLYVLPWVYYLTTGNLLQL